MIDGIGVFSLELLKGAFIAGAVFAAIRGEFRLMKFRVSDAFDKAKEAKEVADKAHTRIDIHLEKGH